MKQLIKLVRGDITKFEGDAIVNAANESLLGGGGVDGAIHKAAGSQLLAACELLHGCKPGEAKITPGFNLAAKFIIHTVGPRYRSDENPPQTLRSCYEESLKLAAGNQCKSIAFPAISTGVFGYPLEAATEIAVNVAIDFIDDGHPDMEITFVCFDRDAYRAYDNYLDQVWDH